MKKFIALAAALVMILSAFIVPGSAYKSFYSAAQATDTINDGDLIYYQGFDYSDIAFPADAATLADGNQTLMTTLGWKILNIADGALKDNTVKYSISNGRLYIDNIFEEGDPQRTTVNDSYCEMIDAQTMWQVVGHGKYTLQYDVELTEDPTDAKDRYVAIVLNYNGCDTYNSFHVRMRGSANNQLRSAGSWLTYDVDGDLRASGSDDGTSSSVIFKLTNGATSYAASTPAMQNLNFTIKYQYDILGTEGPTVYMRNNTIANSEFVKVSEGNIAGTANYMWSPSQVTSFAVALKPSTKIRAYIDNIYIYAGLGDTPTSTVPITRTPEPLPDSTVIRNNQTAYGGVAYVGCQSKTTDSTMSVRLIGAVDSKKYEKAGFTVKVGEVDKSGETTNVYYMLNATGMGTENKFNATDGEASYLYTLVLDDLAKTGDVVIEVTPYTINFEKLRKEADTFIVTYKDGVLVSQTYKTIA